MRVDDGRGWLAKLLDAFPGEFTSITLSKPSIEDVFLAEAGRGPAEGDAP